MFDLPRIQDNPSAVELKKSIAGLSAIKNIVGILEFFGIKNEKLSDALNQLPELVLQANQLIELPDRFNNHFAQRGWIAYESLNGELMAEAVRLADGGNIEKAESLLAGHFTAESMHFSLLRLFHFEAFKPRIELMKKALDDYSAGRYHAAVPVLLMNIDGFVNDIEQTGFFTEITDLTAWDSIAAHSTGLAALCKVLGKSRTKTTDQEITVPYRHGILHGRDLG